MNLENIIYILPGLAVVIALILWKRNALLAISGGALVQIIVIAYRLDNGWEHALGVFQSVLVESTHWKIIGFSFGINIMVLWLSQRRFLEQVINRFFKKIKQRKSGLFLLNFMGYLIFFDDYANTMLIGGVGQEIARKFRISKAKLAYIVDATAAPIASVSLISTWIGFEVGLIEKSLSATSEINAYQVFVQSLPYMFYAWFTLIFILMLNWSQKDFGPMKAAETKILEAQVNASAGTEIHENSFLPALVVISSFLILTILFALYTGYLADKEGVMVDYVFNADFVTALFYSSIVAVVLIAVLTRFANDLRSFIFVSKEASKIMLPVLGLLFCAWFFGDTMKLLLIIDNSTDFRIDQATMPWVVLISYGCSIFLSAVTGSSWSTMSIMFPVVIPLLAGFDPALALMPMTSAAIMSGSVVGDHISPISDTTILSAAACGISVNEHFITQAPYAVTVALISGAAIYFTTIFPVPIWMVFSGSVVLMFLIINFLGRKSII